MQFTGGVLTLDKGEAKAIKEHIEKYGMGLAGLRIKIDVNAKTIDFIGEQDLSLRLAVTP